MGPPATRAVKNRIDIHRAAGTRSGGEGGRKNIPTTFCHEKKWLTGQQRNKKPFSLVSALRLGTLGIPNFNRRG